jgi:hypothetical protein
MRPSAWVAERWRIVASEMLGADVRRPSELPALRLLPDWHIRRDAHKHSTARSRQAQACDGTYDLLVRGVQAAGHPIPCYGREPNSLLLDSR